MKESVYQIKMKKTIIWKGVGELIGDDVSK